MGQQAGGSHPTGTRSCYLPQGNVMFSEAFVCSQGGEGSASRGLGGGRSAVSFVNSTVMSTLVIRNPTALITKKQWVSLKVITHSMNRRNPLKCFGRR